MPAIGCGVMGWNASGAARVAARAFAAHLAALEDRTSSLTRIDLCIYDDAAFGAWREAMCGLWTANRRATSCITRLLQVLWPAYVLLGMLNGS